jgi:hypothetical protein
MHPRDWIRQEIMSVPLALYTAEQQLILGEVISQVMASSFFQVAFWQHFSHDVRVQFSARHRAKL